ncbi:MoaD family protein [Chloroflexota bacterium]
MKVKVRFFASYRELVGQSEIEIEIAKGATVTLLAQEMEQRFSNLALSPLITAVNGDYASSDYVLSDKDEVAFLPPMSGGDLFQITDKPILPEDVISKIQGNEYGGVVVFIGKVRSYSHGKQVLHLEYDAYPEMAEKKMRDIATEIKDKWALKEVAFCHRTGKLEVGEAAVVIAVAAPHRREAFAACQYAIDRLKKTVPVWKKEVWADGEIWVGWETGESEGETTDAP